MKKYQKIIELQSAGIRCSWLYGCKTTRPPRSPGGRWF